MEELVVLKNKQPVTTSLIIAKGTGNQHESIVRLINEHKAHFERWGQIRFSDLKSGNPLGGRPSKVAYLNEQQATFLMTLLRNTGIVVDFKAELVDRFYKMREILLNHQNEQWRAIRKSGKVGNKEMCKAIHDVIIPLARAAGSTVDDEIFYMTYQKAVNKAACVRPKSRDTLALGQLYEIEKLQSIAEISIRGLAARGANYKQIYKNTNQTLENYSRLSFIAERFLPA